MMSPMCHHCAHISCTPRLTLHWNDLHTSVVPEALAWRGALSYAHVWTHYLKHCLTHSKRSSQKVWLRRRASYRVSPHSCFTGNISSAVSLPVLAVPQMQSVHCLPLQPSRTPPFRPSHHPLEWARTTSRLTLHSSLLPPCYLACCPWLNLS